MRDPENLMQAVLAPESTVYADAQRVCLWGTLPRNIVIQVKRRSKSYKDTIMSFTRPHLKHASGDYMMPRLENLPSTPSAATLFRRGENWYDEKRASSGN